jgi:hypothetical protein
MNILSVIEADLLAAWGEVESDAEKFGALIWGDVKPVLLALKPKVYADLRTVIVGILVAFEGKSVADIETGLLNVLSAGESALLADAQALGSGILQRIIAQVMAA